MKRIIWKYTLNDFPECTIKVTKGAEILSLQMQNGVITIWALVDPDITEKEERTFLMFPTGGRPFDTTYLMYLDSIQQGTYVWHVFEVKEPQIISTGGL